MINRQKLLQAMAAGARYATAVIAVLCALAVRLIFHPILGDRAPYLFSFLPIVAVKRLWGRGPALLATLLGGLCAWYFIVAPQFSFAIANRVDALNLIAYFAVGAGISFLGEMPAGLSPSLSLGGKQIQVRLLRQTAVLASAAVVMAGMLLLLFHEFRRTQDAQQWVAHTYQVLNAAESLFSSVKDAETGQRGFLLTGDESYLGGYKSAAAAVPVGLKTLWDLTSDNPGQQARLLEINGLAGQHLSTLARALELYQNSDASGALQLVRSGQGKQSMDQLRAAIDDFRQGELDLLQGRQSQTQLQAARERWVLGLGGGLLIALLVLASVVIERETLRREEITESVRRHAELLEKAHDSLLTCPLGGAIEYWNHGAENLFGYTREEAVGRLPHELLQTSHPDGMNRIDALLRRDGHWQGELTQTTKDGRKLTVEAQWTLAVDAHGRKTVLEAHRDITQRKQAEDALRESQATLAAALASMTDAVFISDDQGRFVHFNDAFATFHKFKSKQGCLQTLAEYPAILEVFLPDGTPVPLDMWAVPRALRGEVVTSAEYSLRRKDTGNTWVGDYSFGPIRDKNGVVVGSVVVARDVTEIKRAEAERTLLATAIEQASETVVVTDREGQIQYVNPAFTRSTGYTRSEAIGQNPRVLKSGVHDGEFYKALWSTVTGGNLWQGEFTNRRKDGTLYIEKATIAPVRAPAGEITSYIAIKSDITESKQREVALRESEMMLRFFVQHAPAAIAMLDRDMRYLVVSQRWMSDYRLGGRDIRGLSHYEVFPEMPERWKEIHRRCLEGAVERCEEDPFPRPDGSVDWVRWEVRPWRKIDESIGGVIVFSELVTARKQAEAALQESELRYRQLFERSESALALHEMVFDAVGNPSDYRFLDVNPAFERNTRLTRSQVVGHTALEVLPGLEEYWIKLYGGVATTGEPAVFESYTSTLGRYYAGSAYSPRPNQFAVSFMDITERKRAEEDLRLLNTELEERVRSRTAALESANRELEAFAHSVSHDLRAPLRGIDGWSLALLEDYGERLDAQGHKYLDRVRSEAQRMGRLIDDLLHLSRVSRTEMVFTPVDLTGLARTIAVRLKEANAGRCLEFIIASRLECTGDARLLEIALSNLLENAAKFTGPRTCAKVRFGKEDYQGTPAFFVRDNGVGFDMTYAKMLFAPFQRLHKNSEFPGTGIGLATVQRVIHRHGGRIWAEAQVGVGATFYFTLGDVKS